MVSKIMKNGGGHHLDMSTKMVKKGAASLACKLGNAGCQQKNKVGGVEEGGKEV